MFNNPYFIPNMYPNLILPRTITNNAIRSIGTRNLGLFSKITNSLKSINWTSMINNTSKTLGIINQTIPIVKQAKPVMNNMKSILKIASLFKEETNSPKINTPSTNQQTQSFNPLNDDYSPTFFISS